MKRARVTMVRAIDGQTSVVAEPTDPVGSATHPLRPLALETPNNLPPALTSFVGRREELARIRNLLSRSRLVTLVGTGGIGKSRLGREIARRSLGSFAGGVWLVDLSGTGGMDAVARVAIESMGLREQPGVGAIETVVQSIGASRVLLVLDECERIADPVATFVADLVRSCPEARIVATSRRPLGISGETLYVVPGLGVSAEPSTLRGLASQDAVTLFVDRIRSQRQDFHLNERSGRLVHELCRQLDGLPLAIELAAARARHFGLDDLVARLTDQSSLLAGGPRDAPARQRSLQATIDWSLGMLGEEARATFPRLAVFRGGFDRTAAEAVAAIGDSSMDRVLSELVDESLLMVEGDTRGPSRYRMLEPIRQHAFLLLSAAGQDEEVLERHARHYADMARGAYGVVDTAGEPRWFDLLEADHDNVRRAIGWALAKDPSLALAMSADLSSFCVRRGHASELLEWVDGALAATPPEAHGPGALLALALALEWSGDFDAALRHARRAQEASRETTERTTEALASMVVGRLEAPDGPKSRAAFDGAVAAARAVGHEGVLSEVLGDYAHIEWALGSREAAVALAWQAVVIARRIGHPDLVVVPATVLARDAMFSGRPEADSLWLESLQASRDAEDPLLVHFCLTFIALRAAWRRDVASSVDALVEAADLLRRAGARPVLLSFVEMVGLIAIRAGRPFEGLRLVLAKERLAGPEWIDSPPWWEYVRTEAEQAFAILGDRADEARRNALAWSPDEALAEAEREIAVLGAVAGRAGRRRTTPLSRRERELTLLVADGLTNREIGQRLFISERTAEAHICHILDKLGLVNRTQIAAWAAAQRVRPEVPS